MLYAGQIIHQKEASITHITCCMQAKSSIRKMLPLGLKDSHSKVRSSVAYAISAIAYWDWPDAWPDLFNILMEALRSGDGNAVHGAMRVLTGTHWIII